MLRFDDLQLFVTTADLGNLSAAARRLDISPAVASAGLKRLEQQLQVRLFSRSTRSLRLTPEGELFLGHARLALQSLDDGRQQLAGSKVGISGPLQLSAPSDFGRNTLLPWLDEFQQAHPQVQLRLLLGDRVADLFREPVSFDVQAFEDLAIDIFIEGPAAVSQDSAAYLTSYIGAPNSGNLVGQNSDEKFGTTITAMPLLEEVSVFSSEIEGTIVAVGGSVVDGVGSNVDQHNRWTDCLAARFVEQVSATKNLTVVNEGISGNTTQDVLDRFDRDILDKSGLSHVVIYAGTNDLSLPPPLGPNAEQIVDNFRRLIEKCHDADKKIIISTITPRLQYFPMSNE